MTGQILSADRLHESAELAIGSVAPGLSLSMGYLAGTGGLLACGHLLSAWRVASSGTVEHTVPFEIVLVSLEAGLLLARRSIRAKDLGIYPGRVLPSELDDYLPGSVPAERESARAYVAENTASVWQTFRDSPSMGPNERDAVRAYQRARIAGLLVRDHIYQEALHPGFHRWMLAT